jgi:hypothetical protein
MRALTERLVASIRTAPSSDPPVHEAAALCERLGNSLIPFAGAEGFAALVRRALALARAEAPALQHVRLDANHHLQGLEEVAGDDNGSEAAVALGAHLLMLLVAFIGEPLTLRLVREGWPDTPLPSRLDT